jgi:hypothetical protein
MKTTTFMLVMPKITHTFKSIILVGKEEDLKTILFRIHLALLNVIILGLTSSDRNKQIITLMKLPFPLNKPTSHLMGPSKTTLK